MTLRGRLRERLKEQNWREATKYRCNQSEVRKDIQGYMKRDLSDLALLADKSPDEMLQEVFTPDRISEFIGAVLHRQQDQAARKELADRINSLRQPITDIQA